MAHHADLPEITDDHRRRAFEILAMAGWTFDLAMANELRRKVIECCAASLRRMDWEHTQQRTVEPVRRVRLGVDGHPIAWCTQMAPGPSKPITQPPLL